MEIIEYTLENQPQLEVLKTNVWSSADREHYGENRPRFLNKTFTLIAQDDNEFLGYITVTIDSGIAHIEPLMVKTELKGKGIGTQLLKAVEEKAKALGVHKVWLETGSDWKAKAFYEKHGYSIRAILPNHTGGREFVLMDKMI